MHTRLIAIPATLVAAGALPATALPSAPPVGPLPHGPVRTLTPAVGVSFTVNLPKPSAPGRVWRVARAYNAKVVREVGEGTRANGSVWITYKAVGRGTTRVVYALTRGERPHAYAARTFQIVVSKGRVR